MSVRSRLKLIWGRAREPVTVTALTAGLAALAAALYDWGQLALVDARSFLIGYVVAAATLFLAVRDKMKDSLAEMTAGLDAERSAAARERHVADIELDRAATRRHQLECRRLERELAEEGWRGEP